MKDSFNMDTGLLGKSCGPKSEEQFHSTFWNLVLKLKLHKAVRFFCSGENGGVLQPNKLAEDRMDIINETVT